MNIGPMEIGLIAVVVLLLFGARKLPELARSAGKAVTEFKKGVRDITDATIVEAQKDAPPAAPPPALPAAKKRSAVRERRHTSPVAKKKKRSR